MLSGNVQENQAFGLDGLKQENLVVYPDGVIFCENVNTVKTSYVFIG
jgi:hypothetical protein